MNEGMMTYFLFHDKTIINPMVGWYIYADGTHLLVDTGINVEDHKKYSRLPMKDIQTFDDALASVGVTPDHIDLIIATHLHYDHIAYAKRCKSARVLVQEEELLFAYSNNPIFSRFYDRSQFDGLKFQLIRGEKEILPGISVLPMPGHTPGCQAVLVETGRGKAVLSGMCTVKDNFYPPKKLSEIWPVIIPTVHVDGIKSFFDMVKLKAIAEILIPIHDIEFARMKHIPSEEEEVSV
jgi:glyoxylase-like metal-dependent hydrolase (beta-lactamase superfamily II)